MRDGEYNDQVSRDLWGLIPAGQKRSAMQSEASCEIDPEFLGFVAIYKNLTQIIPKHFTVIDFGCSYAPQCFLFSEHRSYVGVDLRDGFRFFAENTRHVTAPIIDFIDRGCDGLIDGPVFAICSYVPNWHGENRAKVRESFEHVFVYYTEPNPTNQIHKRGTENE